MAAFRQGETLATSGALLDRQLLAEIDYQRGALWARQEELLGRLRSPLSDRARQSEQAYRAALRVLEGAGEGIPRTARSAGETGTLPQQSGQVLDGDRSSGRGGEDVPRSHQADSTRGRRSDHQVLGGEEVPRGDRAGSGLVPLVAGRALAVGSKRNNLGLLFFNQKRFDLCLEIARDLEGVPREAESGISQL